VALIQLLIPSADQVCVCLAAQMRQPVRVSTPYTVPTARKEPEDMVDWDLAVKYCVC